MLVFPLSVILGFFLKVGWLFMPEKGKNAAIIIFRDFSTYKVIPPKNSFVFWPTLGSDVHENKFPFKT